MKKKKMLNQISIAIVGLLVASCSFSITSKSSKTEKSETTTSTVESSESISNSVSLEESSQAPATSIDSLAESQPVKKTKMQYTYKDYAATNVAGTDYCPNQGSPKLLVIPVWFTDSSNFINMSHKEDVRQDIEKCYFGTNEETGWRSVKTYYSELSQERCVLDGVVSDWYECGYAYTSAAKFSSETARYSFMSTLINDAVEWYFQQDGALDDNDFDLDENGFLDGVMLIYGAPDYYSLYNAGYGYQAMNYDNLWAYTTWLENEASVEAPNANVIFWASYAFMYGTEVAQSRTGSKNFCGGDTAYCNLDTHTFIHEMGHVFGANDYYDYSGSYCPSGGFSMQDNNVGSHDPFTALACGWVDPYIPKQSCEITIRPFQNQGHDLILLTPFWDSMNSPFDEYMLLELYTPTGLNEFDCNHTYKSGQYPKGPKDVGVRLWHVDSRLIKAKRAYANGSVMWDSNPTIDPTESNVYTMLSNTYWSSSSSGYCSVLGQSYSDYNILQLVKNSTTASHKIRSGTYLSSNDLFKDGSSFNMNSYGKQFVNTGKLNSDESLGWSFGVSITGTGENALATITLTKAS